MQDAATEHIVDIPDSWRDRCSGDGHARYVDEKGVRRYVDNNAPVSDEPYRPCARCGKYPNESGDDHCIQGLGRVINACCGHGAHPGYIQFHNGITVRGYFEVERT